MNQTIWKDAPDLRGLSDHGRLSTNIRSEYLSGLERLLIDAGHEQNDGGSVQGGGFYPSNKRLSTKRKSGFFRPRRMVQTFKASFEPNRGKSLDLVREKNPFMRVVHVPEFRCVT